MFRQVAITLEMIKFEHTVFALPFAFLGAFTAAGGVPDLRTIFWILVAMVGARSAAMAFNRLVDAGIDAKNPRTAGRALPAGLVSRGFVLAFTVVSAGIFILAAKMLNPLAFELSPVALLIVLGYSFTKRFTLLSHFLLGLSLAIAPVGAWIAVRGSIDPWIFTLAATVLVWTAGFDVLYSLQDVEFDRTTGLHSIPARIGVKGAFVVARLLHVLTLVCLATFGIHYGFGASYWVGFACALGLLLWQHSIISPRDISRINAAFFTANGILSFAVFLAATTDLMLRR